MIKERPILFSSDMVRAILAGNKTQTRRVVKPQPGKESRCPYGQPGDRLWVRETWCQLLAVSPATDEPIHIGRGEKLIEEPTSWTDKAGDRRWNYDGVVIAYRANSDIEFCDGDGFSGPNANKKDMPRWRPSIHMPRWASRILLEVKAVRVERLQDISEEDAKKEGVEINWCGDPTEWEPDAGYIRYPESENDSAVLTAIESFASLWDSINDKRPGCSWEDNPWVWVIEFEVIEPRQTAE